MDLRLGRPVTLFVSFVLYGTALSVAPRLLRSRAEEDELPPILEPQRERAMARES
jgi:hypothetical protein